MKALERKKRKTDTNITLCLSVARWIPSHTAASSSLTASAFTMSRAWAHPFVFVSFADSRIRSLDDQLVRSSMRVHKRQFILNKSGIRRIFDSGGFRCVCNSFRRSGILAKDFDIIQNLIHFLSIFSINLCSHDREIDNYIDFRTLVKYLEFIRSRQDDADNTYAREIRTNILDALQNEIHD